MDTRVFAVGSIPRLYSEDPKPAEAVQLSVEHNTLTFLEVSEKVL
jgi:hypothetical protein